MPKIGSSLPSKIKTWISHYPELKFDGKSVFCASSEKSVRCKRKSQIDAYCNTVEDNYIESCSNLTIHRRTHTEERPYSCDVCDKLFSKSGGLMVHKRMHTGEKPYACDVCDKSFSVNVGLTKLRRTHTGEKLHACDVCDKSFSISTSLVAHKRMHTGEKPYSKIQSLYEQFNGTQADAHGTLIGLIKEL